MFEFDCSNYSSSVIRNNNPIHIALLYNYDIDDRRTQCIVGIANYSTMKKKTYFFRYPVKFLEISYIYSACYGSKTKGQIEKKKLLFCLQLFFQRTNI